MSFENKSVFETKIGILPSIDSLPTLTQEEQEMPIQGFHEIINSLPKPKPYFYKNTYPEQKLQEDQLKLKEMIMKFDDKAREADTALELCILFGALNEEWFGGNAVASRAHDFDDIFHQTDAILSFRQFEESEGQDEPKIKSYAHLGIDATTSKYKKTVLEKNKKITGRLITNNIGSIEYAYIDDDVYDTKIIGPLDLPQVIVNIPLTHTIHLQKILIKNHNGRKLNANEEEFLDRISKYIFISVVQQLIVQAAYLITEKLKINLKNKKFCSDIEIENNPLAALREINSFFSEPEYTNIFNANEGSPEIKKAAKNLSQYKILLSELENAANINFQ